MNSRQLKTIPVPQKLFGTMFEAYRKWEKFSDEFEDYLLTSEKKFIEKMRKARKEHLNKKIRDLQALKQELK